MAVVKARLGDGRHVFLGRIIPKARPQALRLENYLDRREALAHPPPDEVVYSTAAMRALRRMYGNDQEGCCVVSSAAHQLGVWSGNDTDSGGLVEATDQEIHTQYHEIGGPGDNGLVITDFLDVWKSRGFRAGGKTYRIDGYVSADHTNALEVKVAHYLFGGIKLGINLPQEWLDAPDGGTWGPTNSRIVGGHDVPIVDYVRKGVVICTWGGLRTITWEAFTSGRWVTESYPVLAPLWYGDDRMGPHGIDAKSLADDLAKLSGGVIPDPGPGPVTPPPGPNPIPVGLFHLNFRAAVGKGDRVNFRAPVAIPKGAYDVVPSAAAGKLPKAAAKAEK